MKISPFTFQTEFGLAPDHSAGAPLTVLQREHAPPEKGSPHPAGASPLAIIAGTHGDRTVGHEGSGCTPAVIPC